MAEPKLVDLSPVNPKCEGLSFSDLNTKAALDKCRASTPINPVKFPILYGSSDYYSGSFQTLNSISERIRDGMLEQLDAVTASVSKIKDRSARISANNKVEFERERYSKPEFLKTLRAELDDYVKAKWDYDLYKHQKPSLSDVSGLHEIDLRNLPSVKKFIEASDARRDTTEKNFEERTAAYKKAGEFRLSWQELPIESAPEIKRGPDLRVSLQRIIPATKVTEIAKPDPKPETPAQPPRSVTLPVKKPTVAANETKTTPLPPIPETQPSIISMTLTPLKALEGVLPKPDGLKGAPDLSKIVIMPPQTVAGLIDLYFDQIFSKDVLTKINADSPKAIHNLKTALLGLVAQECAFDVNARNALGDSGPGQFKKNTAIGIVDKYQTELGSLLQRAKDNGFGELRSIRFYADNHSAKDPNMAIRFDGPAAIAMLMLYLKDEAVYFRNVENGFMSYHHGRAAVENHIDAAHHQTGHAVQSNEPDSVTVRAGTRHIKVPWDKMYYVRLLQKGESVLNGKSFAEFVVGGRIEDKNAKTRAGNIVKNCLDREPGDNCKAGYIEIPRDKNINPSRYVAKQNPNPREPLSFKTRGPAD